MNYKELSREELRKYFLENRHDKAALEELRSRKAKVTITIAPDAPQGTFEEVLKKFI